MGEGVVNQIEHMLIRESIKKVRSFAPPPNEAITAQKPQTLRHGRELLAEGLHNLCNAALTARQEFQQAQPRGVAQGAENTARTLQRLGAGVLRAPGGMVGRVAVRYGLGNGGPRGSIFHYLMK